jgi:hypothetical protein
VRGKYGVGSKAAIALPGAKKIPITDTARRALLIILE